MILQNIWKRKTKDVAYILVFLLTYFLFILLFLDPSIELVQFGFYQEFKNLFIYLSVVAAVANSFNGFSLNYNKVKLQLSFGLNRKVILFETINRVIWILFFMILLLFLDNLYLVLLAQKSSILPLSFDVRILIYIFALYVFLSGLGFVLGILGSDEKIFLFWICIVFVISLFGFLFFQNFVWAIVIIMIALSVVTFTWGTMHFYKKRF